ncbi:hypothetical protein V6N12_068662 [Hibiscus sabdariffa]|uniref:Uncharacterized protein n=1 Tax=Hibiscus sabdariffa TaxID=183260 RepID=A0ABR2FR03_9ROSI
MHCSDNLPCQDDKGDASAGRQRVLPGQIILAGTSEFGRASCCVTGLSLSPAELVHAFGLGHEPYSLVS